MASTYKLKDEFDAFVSMVKQHADDVVEDVKAMYEEKKKAVQLEQLDEGE